MQELDIPALAERISEHRFVGSTNNMLADEIDRFRAGAGTAGISDAVDALQEVAQALGETEQTLRTELGKLGVEWQGEAGIMAGSVVQNQAAFSDRAVELLKHMARQVFTQGEAFDRTLHKLPDSQILRDAPDEYSAVDSFLGFFGHETDHAAEVDRVRDARDQAVEALDEYARDSGDNLRAIPTLEAPPEIRADTGAPPADSGEPRTGGGDDVTDTSNWRSAPGAATGSPTAPGAAGEPTGSGPSVGTGTSAAAEGRTPASIPVHPGGTGDAETGSGTRPSGGAEGTGAVSGGSDPRHPATSPIPRTTPGDGSAGSAGTAGRAGGTTAGPPPSGGEGEGAQGSSSAWQQRPGSHGDGSQSLSSGSLSGAAPTKPAPPVMGESGAGPPDTSSRGASSRADAGGAAAVAGAGGVAGALSNEDERRGRGVGRNAPGASRSPRSLALGDLPEEEARVERQSERLGARSGRARDAFLAPAAARDGDEDDSVRRFGVDDQDLFADQRQVSPDVIGEDMQE